MRAGEPGPLTQLVGRGAIYTVATMLQGINLLVAIPILTRLLPVSEFGLVATAIVIIQLATPLAGLGIFGAVNYYYFNDSWGPAFARGLIVLASAGAILVVAMLLASGPVWAQLFENVTFSPAMQLAVVAVLPHVVLQACQSYLRAGDRPFVYVVATLISTLGTQVLGIVALRLFAPTAAWYMTGYVVAVVLGASFAFVRSDVADVRMITGDLVRGALRLGLPTVPHTASLFALAFADRIVIERLSGLAAVGRYQVAYAIGGATLSLAAAINNAWSPLVHRHYSDGDWHLLVSSTRVVLRVVTLAVVGVIFAAPLVTRVLAPASYLVEELGLVAAVVAVAAIPYVVYLSRVHVLFISGRSAPLAVITPLSVFANLFMVTALLPRLGLPGAALATLIAYALQAALLRSASGRVADVPWPGAISMPYLLVAGAAIAASWSTTAAAWPLRTAVGIGFIGIFGAWVLLRSRIEMRAETIGQVTPDPGPTSDGSV